MFMNVDYVEKTEMIGPRRNVKRKDFMLTKEAANLIEAHDDASDLLFVPTTGAGVARYLGGFLQTNEG